MPTKTVQPKPVWCRQCDQRTRLLDLGLTMTRCPRCHPLNITTDQTLPDWCGVCNKHTRHYHDGRTNKTIKCRACHPRPG